MKISVIMPVYNSERHLEKSIRSVIEQVYDEWELIIINDGSCDGSIDICRKYSELDERIKLFSTENGGVSRARNKGLKEASGDYILFLDSDDTISRNCLKDCVECIYETNADICIFGYTIVYANGDIRKVLPKEKKRMMSKTFWEREAPYYFEKSLLHCVGNKLYSSSVIGTIRFEEEWSYHEDIMFALKALNKAQTIITQSDSFYFYNCNEDSLSHCIKLGRYKAAETVYEYVQTNIFSQNEATSLVQVMNDFLLYNMMGELKALAKANIGIKEWKQQVAEFRNDIFMRIDLRNSNIRGAKKRGILYLIRMRMYTLLYIISVFGIKG